MIQTRNSPSNLDRVPDYLWNAMWTILFLTLPVRPFLTLIRESRPPIEFGILSVFGVLIVLTTLNCWRTANSFGVNRWSGVLNAFVSACLLGYSEAFALRPVWSWQLLTLIAVIGSVWILVAKSKGQDAGLPVDLVHLIARPKWRYVTPLKLDFWIIWLGLWVPILFATIILASEFLSQRYVSRHWSWYPLYAFSIAGTIYAACFVRSLLSNRNRNLEALIVPNLVISLLSGAVVCDGLKWPAIGIFGVTLMLIEIPKDAMTKWQSRQLGDERDIHDSLEAPHNGM